MQIFNFQFPSTGFARYDPVLSGLANLDPGVIEFSFKTTFSNGLLLVLYLENSGYLLVQIQDGGLYFEYRNVEDFTSVFFPPNEEVNPCDGQMHSLKLNYNLRTKIRVRNTLLDQDNSSPSYFDDFF